MVFFVCGCELRVVHVGKENKIPFLWCSDKDFYAFYFKSKLNHFLLKISSFHFAHVYCMDQYTSSPNVSFGRFSRAWKTSKIALFSLFMSWWRNLRCDSAYILIECGPGIRSRLSLWANDLRALVSSAMRYACCIGLCEIRTSQMSKCRK